ncbi:hypothetical protein Desku_0842 [Desulfofundulus kuznetsovii DSM 6115]|uniref:TadE family protein n=1 Tax=Desulfofundulus kuznetsovii (strain DSM 6115 / VKM B-1805 / 17) TaxID=760568 RepID=A0AAU8PLT9_DESK7|nr:hypothetical protein Desku_0842 [Desulfofundulus kuznetsovii DSM 6115]
MLDKVIMLPFSMFVIFLFAFTGVVGVVMFGQWCMVQNQAQMVATSMGKWGGYTAEAESAVNEFANQINCPRSQVKVQVSDTGPVPWGKTVWARVSVPFQFRVGQLNIGTYTLPGYGQSVSTYLPGAYNVSYISP